MIGQRKPKQPKRIPAKNRRLVETRSGGVCESCGDKPASNVHHRKYLKRGGTHDVHNLLHLCGMGNTSGCHGRAHSGAEDEGLSVWSHERSEMKPVLYRGVWVLPHDDGVLERLNESTAEMLMSEGRPGNG